MFVPALALALPAAAWPAALGECIARDARRLAPRSLAQLLGQRERLVLDEAQRLDPALSQALAADLSAGALADGTLAALQAETDTPLHLLRQIRVGEGVLRLGALYRVPADLSDPVVTAGPPAFVPGLTSQYYAFVQANLSKLPVVLADPQALKLTRAELPAYWRRVHAESRAQADLLRQGMLRAGRVIDHRTLDYRSPVFAVAQISYSRAVTAVAATWLAVWRESRADLTRQPAPRLVRPADRGRVTDPVPPPSDERPRIERMR